MKRVKESFFREHPLWNNTEGCSGAKEFEGEDLGKDIFGRDTWIFKEGKWHLDEENGLINILRLMWFLIQWFW